MKTRKVIITGPAVVDDAMNLFNENNIDVVLIPPYTDTQEIAKIVGKEQADAILVRMGDVNKDVIQASQNLQVITKHGVGVNNIDIPAATKKKIPVMITPGANSRSVAEHALAMMLTLSKQLISLDNNLRQGKWEKTSFSGTELTGKSIGIIGYGGIGRELIELIRPFRMKVYIYDPVLSKDDVLELVDNLETLYQNADIISLHCPLTDTTRGMIGKDQLKIMKSSSYLVNTARGGLINENDLAWALENGEIAGAGLDSFETEPPKNDTPLWKAPNLIVSPHVGAVTKESLRNMGMQAAANILTVLDKKTIDPYYVVNKEIL